MRGAATSDTRVFTERAQRFPLRIPVEYRRSGSQRWQNGKTINISRTGILFRAEEAIPEKEVLDMRLDLPSKSFMTCLGTVVRVEKTGCAVRISRCKAIKR